MSRVYLCLDYDREGFGSHLWEQTHETSSKPFTSAINCPDHDGIAVHEGPPQPQEED